MEIKSYLKDIPQPPPPPKQQKRIILDLTFDEFAVVLASVGVVENNARDRYLSTNAEPEYCSLNSRLPFYVYQDLRKHAEAAGILKRSR